MFFENVAMYISTIQDFRNTSIQKKSSLKQILKGVATTDRKQS
jgi:hypothetical protein